MGIQLETIINQANEKENLQEACIYIVSELEKLTSNWDIRQRIIEHIEEAYNINIIY